MLNLLATLVVTALPASPAAASTCPDPAANPTLTTAEVAVGECGEAAPLDLWYRMSRIAENEPGGVGAGPARRLQAHRAVTSCEAPQLPAQVSMPDVPPVALVALPTLLPVQGPTHFDGDARDLPARAIAPPERPPRA